MSGPEATQARRGRAGARSLATGPVADRYRLSCSWASCRGSWTTTRSGQHCRPCPRRSWPSSRRDLHWLRRERGTDRILIPALSWPRAVGADLAARAVVSTIPGPTDIATRFVLYRQWAIPADTATAGIVFAAFFETLSTLVLPLIATIGVVVTGQ